VGVQWQIKRLALMFKQIQKHERFEQLAKVRRAHQPGDSAVVPAPGSARDFSRIGLCFQRFLN